MYGGQVVLCCMLLCSSWKNEKQHNKFCYLSLWLNCKILSLQCHNKLCKLYMPQDIIVGHGASREAWGCAWRTHTDSRWHTDVDHNMNTQLSLPSLLSSSTMSSTCLHFSPASQRSHYNYTTTLIQPVPQF